MFISDMVVRRLSFRREVLVTSADVFYRAVGSSSERMPNIGEAVEYALDEVERISKNKTIDWVGLNEELSLSDFGVSSDRLSCGTRFQTSVRLRSHVDVRLDEFIEYISPQFTELKKRKPYRPFAIALLFRAVLAEELGVLPER